MKITRYSNPWPSPQLWADPFHNGVSQWLNHFLDDATPSRETFVPAVDIIEKANAYVLRAELPGMKKEQIHLELKDQTLVIHGERQMEKEDKNDNYHRLERSWGSFSRSFALPASVDSQNIDAKYNDGVLEITLHKKSVSQAAIKIQ